jgi:hypothetical protein
VEWMWWGRGEVEGGCGGNGLGRGGREQHEMWGIGGHDFACGGGTAGVSGGDTGGLVDVCSVGIEDADAEVERDLQQERHLRHLRAGRFCRAWVNRRSSSACLRGRAPMLRNARLPGAAAAAFSACSCLLRSPPPWQRRAWCITGVWEARAKREADRRCSPGPWSSWGIGSTGPWTSRRRG